MMKEGKGEKVSEPSTQLKGEIRKRMEEMEGREREGRNRKEEKRRRLLSIYPSLAAFSFLTLHSLPLSPFFSFCPSFLIPF
jgi:hypothetical protein